MKDSLSDTIVALSTPEGPGWRALLRVSGNRCRETVEALLSRETALRDREAVTGRARIEGGSVPATVVFFQGPKSYTREDVAEIAIPSSPLLVQAVMGELIRLGARPAQPGEFTRRAFLHGRIDLSRAEGVLELVQARSEREAKAGLLLIEGGLGERVAALRARIEEALALVEASLDFEESETGHIETEILRRKLVEASRGLAEASLWESRRAASRGERKAFLWGEPNAGKSSLLNRLDPKACAIVSPVAGTTRDCLRGRMESGEWSLEIFDAAGAEGASDALSQKAQEMASRFRRASDWVIGVVDASRPLPSFLLVEHVDLLVLNKIDLPRVCDLAAWGSRSPVVETSALQGAGIGSLRTALRALLSGAQRAEGEKFALSERHREAIRRTSDEVDEADKILAGRGALDVAASHLRRALESLGEIDGETTSEDILDRIFSQFCLGK